MKNIKLVATDMDHTLLTERNELPPHFGEYVDELDKLGVSFAIASGRAPYTLANIFPDLASKLTLICDNGAIIYHKGKMIYKSVLEDAVLRRIIGFVENETDGVVLLCGLEAVYISSKQKKHEAFLHTYISNITVVDDFSALDDDIVKVTVFFPNKDSKKAYENVFLPKFGSDFSMTVSDVIWIDITKVGVDKGQAMRIVGDYLGIDESQMMAFGDTYNDVEMLKAVKFSYVMENATEDMRQHAKYIAKSNDDYGVTEILKELIGEKQPAR